MTPQSNFKPLALFQVEQVNTIDSDLEPDETINIDIPPDNNNVGGGPTEDNNARGGPVVSLRNRPKHDTNEDEKMKDLESKINALMSAREVKKTGILCSYPREWESILYPTRFNLINFIPFDGKVSPTQHLIYFKSYFGMISGNEVLMVRSFVGTLREPSFD
uniref:Retrotransposon gag domain-containing protein n=1 Tax=Asparagus officinalis TaxID=4686 RepID=Q2AA91_ASPOF|nr:hypothetical protein 17.t00031 [Asparagus officinalis]